MATVDCYLLEETDRTMQWLRRYSSSATRPCSENAGGVSYHQARTRIEDGQAISTGDGSWMADPYEWPRDDPRWPALCATCGYEFQEDDYWQLFFDRIYIRRDTGDETNLVDAAPGAMWYADWYGVKGPDGHALVVKCPNGLDWVIDMPSTGSGGNWTRTGTPPNVTANPSILIGSPGPRQYHGWLRDGKLVDA